MKTPGIILISLQNTFIDFGIRYISSAAKQAGCRVETLWMCEEAEKISGRSVIDSILAFIQSHEVDLIGLSVMSIQFSIAVQLTHAIKERTGIPVIWGGIHALLAPDQCLDYADFVCAGDGERSVPLLVQSLFRGDGHRGIPNIWYRDGSMTIQTERQVIKNLDAFPSPDYDLDHHHLILDGSVEPCTADLLRQFMPWSHLRHYVITSRGCPYHCSYCSNSALKRILGTSHTLRFRSVNNVMQEIREIKEKFPFIEAFAIMDDSFFFKPNGWIEEFCFEFEKIEAGFGVLIHPKTVTRERMDMLVSAGLIGVQMGLQSGSDRTNREIFLRPEPVSEFVKAASILDEYMDKLLVRTYDVIVDNPFETEDDQVQTIQILSRLHKPFNLDIFSLTLFPGTTLYDRAEAENPEWLNSLKAEDKNYLNVRPTMLNRLTWLTHTTNGHIIRFFLKHRHTHQGRLLFMVYDCLWEKGMRVLLRNIKRSVLRVVTRGQKKKDIESTIVRGDNG